uniref:Uncharacterized protein n=1 Tax=Anopheles maculatus TaxID=74869 RepID=A0A182S8I6_9DIPT
MALVRDVPVFLMMRYPFRRATSGSLLSGSTPPTLPPAPPPAPLFHSSAASRLRLAVAAPPPSDGCLIGLVIKLSFVMYLSISSTGGCVWIKFFASWIVLFGSKKAPAGQFLNILEIGRPFRRFTLDRKPDLAQHRVLVRFGWIRRIVIVGLIVYVQKLEITLRLDRRQAVLIVAQYAPPVEATLGPGMAVLVAIALVHDNLLRTATLIVLFSRNRPIAIRYRSVHRKFHLVVDRFFLANLRNAAIPLKEHRIGAWPPGTIFRSTSSNTRTAIHAHTILPCHNQYPVTLHAQYHFGSPLTDLLRRRNRLSSNMMLYELKRAFTTLKSVDPPS